MSSSTSSPGRRGGRGRRRRDPYDDAPSSRDASSALPDEEVDGEDLLEGDMMADYRRIDALDRYRADLLDEREYGAMDASARREAEAAMRDRDRAEGVHRGRRLPAALRDEESTDADTELFRERQRKRRIEMAARGGVVEDDYEEDDFNFDDMPLKERVIHEPWRNARRRKLKMFLKEWVNPQTDGEAPEYPPKYRKVAADNLESLEVSFIHLSVGEPQIAWELVDAPREVLELFDEAALEVIQSEFRDFQRTVRGALHVRISDMSLVVAQVAGAGADGREPERSLNELRNLRQEHLNKLVCVPGVVTRRTGVSPQLSVIRYTCMKCGHISEPVTQRENQKHEARNGSCVECQSHGPFTINSERTIYRNYQKITLQESPGSVPAGRVPRYKEVILTGDLIDSARPGDEIEVTGIYTNSFDASLNTRQGFPVFSTVLTANHVALSADTVVAHKLTADEIAEIDALKNEPNIVERVIASIAPSIYGASHVKTALAMAMFGGNAKLNSSGHRMRGDVNVLLLGDPGTAKSQCLKYVEKTAPRAVYTTGKGASAVGLTAAVHRDPITKEWTLEGGALVLADRGICLIDEFDKMNDADRTSIHEAMEQQSISISKAGIVTSLQARCSVIAAANPIGGRYDPAKTFAENVTLTDPILQRFDILCVLQDTVDPVADARLAEFVVRSHRNSTPLGATPKEHTASPVLGDDTKPDSVKPLDQDLLKRYLMYARSPKVRASLSSNTDMDEIIKVYADIREESQVSEGVPIAVRHLESIVRMAEAHARIRLSDTVQPEDIRAAIRVMLESFIHAQKFAVMRSLRVKFRPHLVDQSHFDHLILYALQELVKESAIEMGHSGHDLDTAFKGLDDDDDFETVDIELSMQAVLDRVKHYEISQNQLSQFTKTDTFKVHKFRLQKKRGKLDTIVYPYPRYR